MKKIIRLLVIAFPVIFCSCDFYSSSSLVNSTQRNLYVEIQYDKKAIRKDWDEQFSFNELFVKKEAQREKFINVDTLNYLINIKVIPKDTVQIDANRGNVLTFNYIKKIKIFGKDTILLENREKMKKAFRKIESGKFILEIK